MLRPNGVAIGGEIAQQIALYRSHAIDLDALNLLGLTTQVPAKAVYLTDRPSRDVRVGNHVISFRRTSTRYLSDDKLGLAVRTLRHLGKDAVDDANDPTAATERVRQRSRGLAFADEQHGGGLDRRGNQWTYNGDASCLFRHHSATSPFSICLQRRRQALVQKRPVD